MISTIPLDFNIKAAYSSTGFALNIASAAIETKMSDYNSH